MIPQRNPHRSRCCSDPNPSTTPVPGATAADGTDTATVTVWCINCNTNLVTLDPPTAAGTDAGDPWFHAVREWPDLRRLRQLDHDLARTLSDLDDGLTDVLVCIGATDITDSDRTLTALELRRQLAQLADDLTLRCECW